MWVSSSPRLGSLRLNKTSYCCSSLACIHAMLWFSIDIVDRVSDASPLYIFISNKRCSTPLTILPTETCTLSALGTFSIGIRPTQGGLTVLRGGSQFLKRICGSGEVGEFIWRRGSGSFTGARRSRGSSGLQERQWYWYRSTGFLGFQQFLQVEF